MMTMAIGRAGAAVAGCRGGELAVWRISGDKVLSKPTVHKTGLPTSICAVAASPVDSSEVRQSSRLQQSFAPKVHTIELPTSICAVAASPINAKYENLSRSIERWVVFLPHMAGYKGDNRIYLIDENRLQMTGHQRVLKTSDRIDLRLQVALGVADGSVLLFDIAAGRVTARLPGGFRGDVQSLAWGRFRCPAPGQVAGSPIGQESGGGPGQADTTAAITADAEARECSSAAQHPSMAVAPSQAEAAGEGEHAHLNEDAATAPREKAAAAAAEPQAPDAFDGEAAATAPAEADLQASAMTLAAALAALAAEQPAGQQPEQQPEAVFCDLLAAGARDGTLQIWDCRFASFHLSPFFRTTANLRRLIQGTYCIIINSVLDRQAAHEQVIRSSCSTSGAAGAAATVRAEFA